MPILDGGSASGIPITHTTLSITNEIVEVVNQQLQDDGFIQWPPDDLIPYINLAIAEVIRVRPIAYPVTKTITLSAGSRQVIGTSEIQILDVVCNMIAGTSGTVVGTSTTILPRRSLDSLIPNWQNFTSSNTVLHVIRDDFDPYTFYTFPPQPSGTTGLVRMIFSELPVELESIDDAFPLEQSYKIPVINYTLGLVLREETTIQGSQAKSDKCMAMFYNSLSVPLPQDKKRGGQPAT